MPMIRRGAQASARWLLLACGILAMASAPHPANAADEGIVDVHTLPRLDGAVVDTSRPDTYRVTYIVPTGVAAASEATKKLLSADGWVPYVYPLDEKSSTLTFKKGRQGLRASFTQARGQSAVSYTPNRIYSNVPFPDGATELVFDETRPYLGCIAPGALDATSAFFAKEMAAMGWRKLTPETAARWPNADLAETVPNGMRVFYDHPDGDTTQFYKQKPVVLILTRRDDGRTNVEIRVAPFALPEALQADDDMAGLPRPKPTKSARSLGGASSNKREISAATMAELPAVLAFYRRELAARGWPEDGSAPLAPGDEVAIRISSAEDTAVLRLAGTLPLPLAGGRGASSRWPDQSPGTRNHRSRPAKSTSCKTRNEPSNRAFCNAGNRPPKALKIGLKTLFPQMVAGRYFALGASGLSWHK